MKPNSCFEEEEFILLLITLTQTSNKYQYRLNTEKIRRVTILLL